MKASSKMLKAERIANEAGDSLDLAGDLNKLSATKATRKGINNNVGDAVENVVEYS